MQFLNLALAGAALLLATQAAPNPMQLEFSLHKDNPAAIFAEVCLLICFPEKPGCQEPSYSKKFGECWTCCTKVGEDIAPLKISPPSNKASTAKKEDISVIINTNDDVGTINSYDLCLKVCWSEIPKCHDGWYSNNPGTEDEPCWTCCKAPEDSKVQSALLIEGLRQWEM